MAGQRFHTTHSDIVPTRATAFELDHELRFVLAVTFVVEEGELAALGANRISAWAVALPVRGERAGGQGTQYHDDEHAACQRPVVTVARRKSKSHVHKNDFFN